MQYLTANPLISQNRAPYLVCLLLAYSLVLPARVSAIEDPPGCSLANGGLGNTSQGGINFSLAQAHVGDAVPVFPNLGMALNGCRAINATGAIYIATGLLTNFLVNVVLDPGTLISCPANALCRPGPYNIVITPAMVGAPVNTPLGDIPGAPKSVRAVENGFGTVLAGAVNEQLSDFHTTSIQIVTPCIQVFKTCDRAPGQTCFPAETPVRFRGYVTNCGDITLTNVTVIDSRAGQMQLFNPTNGSALTGNVILPVGAYAVFSNSFLPSLQETCTGNDSSIIIATGRDTTLIGGPNAAVTNSYTDVCPICSVPAIAITKQCPSSPIQQGGVVIFTGSVSNAGNITLTNIFVVNNQPVANTAVLGPITLAPGAGTNFSGSYTVPLNVCSITDTLTATGQEKCTGTPVAANATATCPVLGVPNIAVTLACPVTPTPSGGTLTFSGNVNNSGNVTLSNVVVRRDIPGPSTVVFSAASLAPGASASFNGSYTVPASNACSITTAVSVSANDPCAGAAVTASATTSCPLATTPGILVTQVCPANPAVPGGLILNSGSVSNTGNVTLTNIMVVSSQPAPNTVVFTLGSLAPGATASFSSSFNAPLDACSASATLTATGQNQCNGSLVNNSVATTCPLVTAPAIRVTKACPVTTVTEGGLLVFTGTVTNTGNITLTNIFVVNNRPAANTAVLGPITLAPGAGTNFTGSYTAPLNACSVADTLTVSGRDKCTGSTASNSVTVACAITTIPRLAVTLACPPAASATGGPITYTGTVSNPGNVTLANVVVVNSQSVPNRVLTLATLAPGASANFIASFTAPSDTCSVSSVVTATGRDACTESNVLASASATCPLVTAPRIAVTQSCSASPGDPFNFSGTVMNTGNVTLTNVVVTNNRSGVTPVFTAATLAPGASASFTGSYSVTTNSGCSLTSTLTGSGNDKCTGVSVSTNVTMTCPLQMAPRIIVTQTCPTNLVSPGGVLTYTGSVSNAGNITLTNIVVVNNRPATNTVIFTVPSLAPGDSANFTGSYQVPLNCCVVSSTVGATGRDTCTGATVADTFTATCPVRTVPRIVVTKSCPTKSDQPGMLKWNLPGELLTYTGTVSNAGDITLVSVTVVNTQPNVGSPVFGPVTLAPGESASYTGAYVVPMDFCGTDVVTARGLDACTFTPVVDSVTTTCPVMTTPRIAVTKNCPTQITPRGGLFTFMGTVSNPGDVTLTNVMVEDNYQVDCLTWTNGPVIGPITLAPGAAVNFSGSYIALVDCCETTDTVTARGQDRCSGSNVTATATARCPLLGTPGITVTRVCPASPVPVGGVFAYSGSVSNTGDVVLTNVLVFSSQPNANTLVLGPLELAPGESKFFSGSYAVAANSNPATDTVTARGTDNCQARTVTATANCSGSVLPLAITSVTLVNGIVRIAWSATPGTIYTLQYKTNLLDSSWISLPGNVTAIGTTASKYDAVGTTRQRFYRVVIAQ